MTMGYLNKIHFILYIFYFSQFVKLGKSNLDTNRVYNVALNTEGTFKLFWTLNYPGKFVNFELHLPGDDFSWFALGFSDHGEHTPADYCVLSRYINRNWLLQDVSAKVDGLVTLDTKQDCDRFKILVTRNNVVKFTFRRMFDTCDQADYIIEEGTTHIVWAKGSETLYKVDGFNISTSRENQGMTRVQLLKNIFYEEPDLSQTRTIEVLTSDVHVPAKETTYWCQIHKLPKYLIEKHHIVKYEPVITKGNEGVVHHIEVFRCIAPREDVIPDYAGSCFDKARPDKTKVCQRVMAAWAMGAIGFTYPEEAGLPIGGEELNPYVMLEVHYNNPQEKAGFVDNSGIRFYLTDDLRPMDAGIIELGLEYTDKMAIPPKQDSFPLSGYCIPECTAVSLNPEGITVFGSQLHTHLTGVKVLTRHFRDGYELPELNRDNHYSTHFQEIRRLKRPVKILPGDFLITTCYFNTMERTNVTFGGHSITDEMCVNYIHYFPASSLEVCKSAISDQSLMTFFRYMNDWEDQATSPSLGVRANYDAVHWSRMRAQLLREVYAESPLSMQCNMSSGDRFPGYWENAVLPLVRVPLAPPARLCTDIEVDADIEE